MTTERRISKLLESFHLSAHCETTAGDDVGRSVFECAKIGLLPNLRVPVP